MSRLFSTSVPPPLMKPPQAAPRAYHGVSLLFFRYITRLSSSKAKLHRVLMVSQNGVVYLCDADGRTTRTFHPHKVAAIMFMKDETSAVLSFQSADGSEPDLFVFFEVAKVVSTESDRAKTNPVEATLPYFIELLLFFNPSIELKYEKDLPAGEKITPNLKKSKQQKKSDAAQLVTSGVVGFVKQTAAKNSVPDSPTKEVDKFNLSNDAAFGEMVTGGSDHGGSPTLGNSPTDTPLQQHAQTPTPTTQTTKLVSGANAKNTLLLKCHCRKGSAGSGPVVTHTLLESASATIPGTTVPPLADASLVNKSFVFLRLVDSPPGTIVSRTTTNYSHLMVIGPTGTLTLHKEGAVITSLPLSQLNRITPIRHEQGVFVVRLLTSTSSLNFTFVEEDDGEPSGTLLYFQDVCKTLCSKITIDPPAVDDLLLLEKSSIASQPNLQSLVAGKDGSFKSLTEDRTDGTASPTRFGNGHRAEQRNRELKQQIQQEKELLVEIDSRISTTNQELLATAHPISQTQLHNLALLILKACEGAPESRPHDF